MTSSKTFKFFLNTYDDVIFIMELHYLSCQYISTSIEKPRSYTQQEVYAHPTVRYHCLTSCQQSQIVAEIKPYIEKGSFSLQCPMVINNGETKWHSTIIASAATTEGQYPLSGFMRCTTKQKNIAHAQENQKTEYEKLCNNAPCAYHSLGARGRLITSKPV